jgi:hypothetical protein
MKLKIKRGIANVYLFLDTDLYSYAKGVFSYSLGLSRGTRTYPRDTHLQPFNLEEVASFTSQDRYQI